MFLFLARPDGLRSGIVMAACRFAVHALADAIFGSCFPVSFAGVLRSTVRVDNGSPERRIRVDGIVKGSFT